MTAYDKTALANLRLTKECKSWFGAKFISRKQYKAIESAYPCNFYHPNLVIRILLFLATLVALSGVTGLFALALFDAFENAIEFLALMYGLASWIILEVLFIRTNKHYKSGVNEALLYHSAGWVFGGLAAMTDFNEHFMLVSGVAITLFAAIRYADLIATTMCIGLFGSFLFYESYEAGEAMQKFIPVIFVIAYSVLYILIRQVKSAHAHGPWQDCITIAEFVSLLVIYAAGNYLVVRELSVAMLDLDLQNGSDIPLAWLFYFLTIAVPLAYLYFGIRRRDMVMLRASLLALAFSVFTFKYYYSLGYHEITLTLSGAGLIAIALYIYRYLETDRGGFTREKLLKEKWAEANPEAFVISQTLGGNKPAGETIEAGGGGESGGGGSRDSW